MYSSSLTNGARVASSSGCSGKMEQPGIVFRAANGEALERRCHADCPKERQQNWGVPAQQSRIASGNCVPTTTHVYRPASPCQAPKLCPRSPILQRGWRRSCIDFPGCSQEMCISRIGTFHAVPQHRGRDRSGPRGRRGGQQLPPQEQVTVPDLLADLKSRSEVRCVSTYA